MSNVDELVKTLKDVIQAYIDENAIPLAEMIGALELIKQVYIEQAFEDEEEE